MQKTTRYIQKSLEGIYPPEEIRAMTRLIWEDACGFSPVDVILRKDTVLDESLRKKIEVIVEKLLQQEPIQYILGHAYFAGERFKVGPGVLIPRPETEELTLLIMRENKNRQLRKIADIGTGSGCIAITLSRHFHDCRIEGWDISPEALCIATENNQNLGASVSFLQRDILQYTPHAEELYTYDLIVSNPPYIVPSEMAGMEPHVLDYEPHTALFVPENDPLLFYRAIARVGKKLLCKGGKLYFEINPIFARDMSEMLFSEGYCDVRTDNDLFGRQRFASATR
ncbi:MAG TPA: peptide chain release factor N(5)-glutamine methyltransferase [Candidatus Caccoplasma intestinavium]|jgi:protein-(glutamine-N5) methyltransferase, release factor-specific|uniref:Release factor glutamine methyltransferase n=1 Tax=Candidatus Caccoplasma intestinavium TaxID=2840716 RepID=A0A9D1KC00_9BACT|nr:release factor glutamine methyltransferase [Bacteroides sp. CAG:144]HIT38878.1 peptide chain release factor N(5)-glutamine methyltransferase [Candidatus Caccoplasma intestinavium]